jgi:hypothetical protein
MATIRTWPLALALLLLLPAAAEASYKYAATIRFSGTYTADEIDGGVVLGHVQSATRFTVRDRRLVVTVENGAIALYPSGNTTARVATTQAGFQLACDTVHQTFTDRVARNPDRAWVTLRRRGSRAAIGFGWMGGSVNRRYAAVTEGECSEPAEVDEGGGTDDLAGGAAMLARFGVTLRVPLSALMHGRSISRKVTVHKALTDVDEGAGTRSRLDGSYRIVLSRSG